MKQVKIKLNLKKYPFENLCNQKNFFNLIKSRKQKYFFYKNVLTELDEIEKFCNHIDELVDEKKFIENNFSANQKMIISLFNQRLRNSITPKFFRAKDVNEKNEN